MPSLVSIHGAHSGQFCGHASDSLEGIVQAYVEQGFAWVGVTEHMPPDLQDIIYPEEADAGMRPDDLLRRFDSYMQTARELQSSYRDDIELLVGFETECYPGYEPHLQGLLDRFQPDYIVGSVHHVHDLMIDFSRETFLQAATASGGVERLYCNYLDCQYGLIEAFSPAVVGHFDLIRLWDADYATTLRHPEVWERVVRNLELVCSRGLILDYNVRALDKGASEPYVSGPILAAAIDLGIALVPGDDSHSAEGAGLNVDRGIAALREAGYSLNWRKPQRNPTLPS